MTGILLAMGGVGSLVAAAPLVWLSDLLGWRMAFVLIGVLNVDHRNFRRHICP